MNTDDGLTGTDQVRLRREGPLGHVVLNRPEALNALTLPMVRAISRALECWAEDEAVEVVALTGAGERGLCAGGDIVAIHRAATGADPGAAEEFWRAEYRLNALIARYPKPYVAVMDGIVMGGGVGLAAHGNLRVVTERSRIAMPETGIGFVPDVGGTYLLALAPGLTGTHLALTADAVGAGDALALGLADHFVPSGRLPTLLADLATRPVREALIRHVNTPPHGSLIEQRDWIDECYDARDAEEIVERLLGCGRPEAKAAAERILANSPTAVKTTLAAMRRVPGLGPLEAVLDQEFRVSVAGLSDPDFVEGVRAQVIDKDRTPHWSPRTLEGVTADAVERHFAPLGERELRLAETADFRERW